MKLPPAFVKGKKEINAVIETPNGSRNKYYYNEKNDLFQLKKTLPNGTVFPLDFGFIPHTKGQDGDPLDVLVIMDSPSYPGCVIECRLIGIIEAEQKEKKEKPVRNDRIVAVATKSLDHSELKKIEDLNEHLLNQVIHFFKYYNEMAGKKFTLLGTKNKKAALKLVKKHLVAGKK